MRHIYFLDPSRPRARAAGVLLIGLLAALRLPAAQAQGPNRVPGQYIVVLNDQNGDAATTADGLARRHGLGLLNVYGEGLKGFVAHVPPGRLGELGNDPSVRYVEQDQVVSVSAQVLPTGINRIDADLSSTLAGNGSGSVSVPVAVIDTGIQSNHPDLNVVGGINFSSGNTSRWNDGNGHGTHVAGTIGALDNGLGVVGVAPGTPLWAVKVLNDQGSGTWSNVISGINWVAANAASKGIKVANMSLGGGYSKAVNDAVTNAVNKGVVFCVAAGNESTDAATTSPASCRDAITVAALADTNGQSGGGGGSTPYGLDDTMATFSNFGSVVDIIAPGVNILSTWKGSSYATISGTSMATPHVTGAAALYIAGHSGATPATVAGALIGSSLETIGGYPVLNVQGF
jgi:subtilisin